MVTAIVVWGVLAFAASGIAGIAAGLKNRDFSFWMGWCFIVPPLVLFLLFLPRYQGRRPRRPTMDEEDAAQA